MPLPSLDALSIKNSYIEELNINCEYNKFKSLFIFGTKLKSLDVSKLPNLQQLYVPCN